MKTIKYIKKSGQYIGQGDALLFDHKDSICSHIERQVDKSPTAIALTFQNIRLSFQQLNDQSNQLANYLTGHGLRPGGKAAIYLEPGIEMLVSILAILKTGACYIPLDINYPDDRVLFMLKDSGAVILLSNSKQQNALSSSPLIRIDMDKILTETEALPTTFRALATATSIAYIIYTSGSTGVPKGVQVSHLAVNNHMLWMQQRFEFGEKDKVLQKTPLSFDPSVWEIFIPLYSGAELVIAPTGSHVDPEALIDLILTHHITTLQLVPSILKQLLNNKRIKHCHTLRHIFVGGESLRPEIKTLFFATLSCSLINLYGPTEATIDITSHQVSPSKYDINTNIIGRAITNTSLYVVNKEGNLASINEEGELYIGSLSLFTGYHCRDALTHEHLIDNPFEPEKYSKLYKTGDWVRWLSSGNLEYLGRNNDQVKINGVRIEPKELVLSILKHPDVSDCIVIKKIDTHGHDYLACYLTPKQNPDINLVAIKKDLKKHFPAYMLPKVYISIQAIPLTVNGKVDVSALPEPDFKQAMILHDEASNETHDFMLLWQTVLETNQISPEDNFFDAGGGSLLALKLIALIQERFNVAIRIRDIYTHPTLKEQIKLIQRLQQSHDNDNNPESAIPNPIICLQAKGKKTPLFLIHPIGGTVFWFSKLARLLNDSRPVYGIQDPGIDLEKPVLNSIEEMATFYLQHIRKIQKQGPYLIGGASFGATVAVEIAHLLKQNNEDTAAIIVLDGWGVYPDTLLDDNYFKTSMLRQHAELKEDFKKYGLPAPDILFDIQWFRLNLLWKYRMTLIESPIALFKSEDILPAFCDIDAPLNHWENFSNKDISCHMVPGNHETMFQEPHVYELSNEINKYLTRSRI